MFLSLFPFRDPVQPVGEVSGASSALLFTERTQAETSPCRPEAF